MQSSVKPRQVSIKEIIKDMYQFISQVEAEVNNWA